MLVNLASGATAWLIGDPHMGKNFSVGVPLARRGEREASQLAQFNDELNTQADYVIIMGDLFDHPTVGYRVVLETYKAIANAAARNSHQCYIVMCGNHDVPRDMNNVGAFHVLAAMLHQRADNISVVMFPQIVGKVAVFPWQWEETSVEQVIMKSLLPGKPELIVGHWDLIQHGENISHMAPVAELTKRYGNLPIYSGHYHVPGLYTIDGVDVICTGSMQPYSHGEDPEGELYVTLTLDQLEGADVRDKCVRVILKEGEELPENVDCLALTAKKEAEEVQDERPLGTFDWSEILDNKLQDVPDPAHGYIKDRL